MDKYNDEIIYNNNDVEKYILENKPKSLIIYQNEDDIHHYENHFLPFKDFVSKYKLQKFIRLISFKYKSETKLTETQHHSIRFPDNTKHIDILREFIKTN